MRDFRKMVVGILVCCLSAATFTMPAMAAKKAETRTPISSVSLHVHSDVRAEYDIEAASVSFSTDSSLYTIGAYTWDMKNKEYWELGDEPKVKVEIHARSGYYFYKTTGSSKFQIDGATYGSVKRENDDETLVLTLKLNPVSGTLDATENAEWIGYPIGKGTWDAVPYAGAYELKLYRDGEVIQGIPKVNATTYDFFPFMTQPGTYQFRVRAIPKNTEEEKYVVSGDWVYSEEMTVSHDETYGSENHERREQLTPENLGWEKDSEGWWYRNTDGTYPTNTWQNIDGAWYLFGYDGYILTGWQLKDGHYYFLDSNGKMQTGWLMDNRNWYYLGNDGIMQTGWITVDGKRYYMDPNGSMHKEWLLDNGKWYYLSTEDGSMVKDTYIGGDYLNSEGVLVR